MKAFHNKDGKPVLMRMVSGIKENKDYLGEIDGLIGDGDHGMNMNKGFSLFQQRFEKETFDLSEGLRELGMILLNEIGGSMGPIYGTVFMAMADEADGKDEITVSDLYQMLDQAKKELEELVGARTGDKTLMDTLTPAVAALEKAGQEGAGYADCPCTDEKGCREWKRFHEGYDSKIRTCQQTWGTVKRCTGCRGCILLYPASELCRRYNGGDRVKLAIGCDEAAYQLKKTIMEHLSDIGVEYEDYGAAEGETVLYPDIARKVAEAVAEGKYERGILVCGTGIGMAITANKVPGIRAAVCHDPYSAERARKSNDAQILCMGERVIGKELAKCLVDIWLKAEFSGGGSLPKVKRIGEVEQYYFDKVKKQASD